MVIRVVGSVFVVHAHLLRALNKLAVNPPTMPADSLGYQSSYVLRSIRVSIPFAVRGPDPAKWTNAYLWEGKWFADVPDVSDLLSPGALWRLEPDEEALVSAMAAELIKLIRSKEVSFDISFCVLRNAGVDVLGMGPATGCFPGAPGGEAPESDSQALDGRVFVSFKVG